MSMPKNLREQVLAAMSTWMASIADNVNNPVAGITAALALIEREMVACRATGQFHQDLVDGSLKRISNRLDTLSDYLAELKEVARPAPMIPTRVQVAEAFAMARLLRRGDDSVRIECLVEPSAESITADAVRLKATLKALVLNGLEAAGGMGKPPPQLRLTSSRETCGLVSGVTLMIEDNGPGFNIAELSQVTDPFFSTKEASSGLGLTTAKRFTEAHGGTLTLGVSAALSGAAVSLFLPDPFLFTHPKGDANR